MKSLKILALFTLMGALSADAQVVVNGGLTQRFSILPGSSTVIHLELRNVEDKVNRVTFKPMDYHVDCEKGYLYDEAGKEERSLANWLVLETEELVLAPKESRTLSINVQVPPNYQHSNAHACIMVNNVPLVDANSNKATLGIAVRYAVNFLYTNPNISRLTDLYANNLVIRPLPNGMKQLRVSYTNLGNVTTSFATKAELLTQDGTLAYNYIAPRQTIQPRQCRTVVIPVDSSFVGAYELILFSETETGEMFGITESIHLK